MSQKVIYATVISDSAATATEVLYAIYGDLALMIESVPGPVSLTGPWRFKVTFDDGKDTEGMIPPEVRS